MLPSGVNRKISYLFKERVIGRNDLTYWCLSGGYASGSNPNFCTDPFKRQYKIFQNLFLELSV